MSYLEMRPVPPKDCVVEVESPGEPEAGKGAIFENSVRRSRFYENPSLPRVWFEPVLVRRHMTEREVADRSQFFDALQAERRTDVILISFFVVVLILFILFFILLFSGVIPFCNTN